MSTKLDKAVAYAKKVAGIGDDALAETIARAAEVAGNEPVLNETHIRELERRLADPDPALATDEQIKAVFGKTFS